MKINAVVNGKCCCKIEKNFNIVNKVFLPRTLMDDFSFFCFEVRKVPTLLPLKSFYGAFRSNFCHLSLGESYEKKELF